MGRFRIRWGDKELEYEGEESDERYAEAFDWIKSLGGPSRVSQIGSGQQTREQKQRGGRRQAIFAPEIKKLVEEGFFKLPDRKKTQEIIKALEDRGLPVSGKDAAIINACRRLLRSGALKGTKTKEGWVFWQE